MIFQVSCIRTWRGPVPSGPLWEKGEILNFKSHHLPNVDLYTIIFLILFSSAGGGGGGRGVRDD